MNTDPIVINCEDVHCTWGQQDVTVYPLNEESIDATLLMVFSQPIIGLAD